MRTGWERACSVDKDSSACTSLYSPVEEYTGIYSSPYLYNLGAQITNIIESTPLRGRESRQPRFYTFLIPTPDTNHVCVCSTTGWCSSWPLSSFSLINYNELTLTHTHRSRADVPATTKYKKLKKKKKKKRKNEKKTKKTTKQKRIKLKNK